MTSTNVYRQDLSSIPQRLLSRPVERGYPVPWFAAQVDGKYDFRVVDAPKIQLATRKRLCWICGQKLGAYLAFPIGPMCAVNRTISEPPSHRECAEWSIKACPFLAQRQDYRRESHMPKGIKEPAGFGLKRQPGATCLWITKSFEPFSDGRGGVLFELGEPTEVLWFKEGRSATRAEVLESIDSGYPHLLELAKLDGEEGIRELERRRKAIAPLLPNQVDGGDRS